jgi:MOSC domain-containing protein YiiM
MPQDGAMSRAPTAGPHVLSVNVGRPKPVGYAGVVGRTSIDKRPVEGPVPVRHDGLDGDTVSDTKHHGGTYQAVYAFAREDLDRWTPRLGEAVPCGGFGENLTTIGVDVSGAEMGEAWRVGSSLLQVVSVRIPCSTFQGWMAASGQDRAGSGRGWVRRFTAEGRPGAYLRVLEEGELRAGDPVEAVGRPGHGVTVATMFRALTTEQGLLPRLLEVEGLPDEVYQRARRYVARRTG